ncbi:hypothetical protein RDABS01_019000 [Bienertia sinuspersici]
MRELAMKYWSIDVYVLHNDCESQLYSKEQATTVMHTEVLVAEKNDILPPDRPKKLTLRKGQATHGATSSKAKNIATSLKQKNTDIQKANEAGDFLSNYNWIDPKPDSPLRLNELLSELGEVLDDDPPYEPGSGSSYRKQQIDDELDVDLEDGLQDEFDVELDVVLSGDEELQLESDTSDEEYLIVKERVRSCNSKLLVVAQHLKLEAAEGKLTAQQSSLNQSTAVEEEEDNRGYQSEYCDSEDDIHTPHESEDEYEIGRRSKRGLLVDPETDFIKFKWKVGQQFATRDNFKQAVSKYAIIQGRNVGVAINNKSRRQELGIRCMAGCPFIYTAVGILTFTVKRVDGVHTCHRNMKKNRQLKSTWVAREMLEVFKAKPHWPAKDIIETIQRAYKVVVKKEFLYKVKYYAHRLLHGSMQEHYNKVRRYVEAMKVASKGIVLDLVVDRSTQTFSPVFQRFFTCFEGLQSGWKQGCGRVIYIDAAFLKTFLRGHIISAIGKDPNEKMFPAAVEGKNINS